MRGWLGSQSGGAGLREQSVFKLGTNRYNFILDYSVTHRNEMAESILQPAQLTRQLQVLSTDKLYGKDGKVSDTHHDRFYRLLVTRGGVAWLVWKKDEHDRNSRPSCRLFLSFREFENSPDLHRILDKFVHPNCTEHIVRLINSDLDVFSKVEERMALKLITYLDVKSVLNLMLVSRHFYRLCNQPSVWEILYAIHFSKTSHSVARYGDAHGQWKTMFKERHELELSIVVEQWYSYHLAYNRSIVSESETSLDSLSESDSSSSCIFPPPQSGSSSSLILPPPPLSPKAKGVNLKSTSANPPLKRNPDRRPSISCPELDFFIQKTTASPKVETSLQPIWPKDKTSPMSETLSPDVSSPGPKALTSPHASPNSKPPSPDKAMMSPRRSPTPKRSPYHLKELDEPIKTSPSPTKDSPRSRLGKKRSQSPRMSPSPQTSSSPTKSNSPNKSKSPSSPVKTVSAYTRKSTSPFNVLVTKTTEAGSAIVDLKRSADSDATQISGQKSSTD